MMTFQKSGTIHVICIFLVLYVAPYLVMSRIGFWRADNITNVDGFYFVEPSTPFLETVNLCCVVIFAPLTWFDNALGTGRPVGCGSWHSISRHGINRPAAPPGLREASKLQQKEEERDTRHT